MLGGKVGKSALQQETESFSLKYLIQLKNRTRDVSYVYLKAPTISGSLVKRSGCPIESRHRSAWNNLLRLIYREQIRTLMRKRNWAKYWCQPLDILLEQPFSHLPDFLIAASTLLAQAEWESQYVELLSLMRPDLPKKFQSMTINTYNHLNLSILCNFYSSTIQ